MDEYLKTFMARYEEWMDKKLINQSSRVIPVGESLFGVQHVLPSEQASDILRSARLITLARCRCRDHYNRCDKPREVCFILNQTGEKWIEK